MRFNKAELASLVSNPATEFEKEGKLIITERQEGLFRRLEVNCARWCKLRGNLLFYLKDHEPNSQPAGLIVLENCRPLIRNENIEFDGFAFIIEFEGSLPQRLCAFTAKERLEWVKCIQLASYVYLCRQISCLEKEILSKMGNRIESGHVDAEEGQAAVEADFPFKNAIMHNVEEDISECPICESALSCDNLPCDSLGRAPNARILCSVLNSETNWSWQDFARTEIVQSSINPQFLCTICFRQSRNFSAKTILRFTVCDVREKFSSISVPIGYAEVALGVIQDATRFRIPLRCAKSENSFITIASWAPKLEKQVPPRSSTQFFEKQKKGHRRTQSLPSTLGTELFLPFQGSIQRVFANPTIHTYRLDSSLDRDISIHEIMMESKLCFTIPQQLLSIWIHREKELLQEISGMGELGGEWRRRQMDLLDKHLKLLTDYSQAKQSIQQLTIDNAPYFKQSAMKTDECLEFLPINLHLQRMCARNDTLNRTGVSDIITVGAFARHSVKTASGGLIKLLQESKELASKMRKNHDSKVQAANDVVLAIKQLRKEIVEIMLQLLSLAKCKNSKGMIPLCNEIIAKTKTLLNLWEPYLVEEAFAFIEQHRIIEEPDNMLIPPSPFRKITQQLSALNLKSPELEDFTTPLAAPPDLWPRMRSLPAGKSLIRSNSFDTQISPSAVDIDVVFALHHHVKRYNEQLKIQANDNEAKDELGAATFESLPINWHSTSKNLNISDTLPKIRNLDKEEELDSFEPFPIANTTLNVGFLDTRAMSNCPSANYYRPTEEPEPLDLTQLNIEASVMCLVSKIKFLCGRCGSPAIRLRHPKPAMKREGFSHSLLNPTAPDLVTEKTIMPKNESGVDLYLHLKHTTILNSNQADLTHEQTTTHKRGNKFTDGLDLSLTTDWTSELRPSMRKLRYAMDGLLKTARLIHSVQRLQQDMESNSINLDIMYRRDVCFSQALTALVSGLMAKLWGTEITDSFIRILCNIGPLAYFEGLLSLYGSETDFWGDMCIAIEDLSAIEFTLIRSSRYSCTDITPLARVTGTRQNLQVLLPVPEEVYAILPTEKTVSFKVTPVFFNIGINEKATLAETLGMTRKQTRSNWDNYARLKQYYSHFRKQILGTVPVFNHQQLNTLPLEPLNKIMNLLELQLNSNSTKNVTILQLAEDACRLMYGVRFTSCKSAKDRTGMAVTIEQCRILVQEFQLPSKSLPLVLSTMRSEGTRMDNVFKNIGIHKYAFNLPQVFSLPSVYRPPIGTYGKAET